MGCAGLLIAGSCRRGGTDERGKAPWSGLVSPFDYKLNAKCPLICWELPVETRVALTAPGASRESGGKVPEV